MEGRGTEAMEHEVKDALAFAMNEFSFLPLVPSERETTTTERPPAASPQQRVNVRSSMYGRVSDGAY
jgi:hypothetical protein